MYDAKVIKNDNRYHLVDLRTEIFPLKIMHHTNLHMKCKLNILAFSEC